jgi:DNA polymerase-4
LETRILHIDMDAFFASVEEVLHPELRGKALIVGGDQDSRGVVCTASYEARKYGVHSAMPLSHARRLCPHGIFVKGSFEHYRAASEKMREVLETVSPIVEAASIDEAYVDISGSQKLFGGDDAIARHIKEQIRERTQLPCTVAIAPNKMVAKVATDEAKPDGYLRIGAGEEAFFLRPLPIRKLPGVGPRTCEMLESMGIRTIGVLADLSERTLQNVFGEAGYGLQRAARGICTVPVVPHSTPKSISRETTFEQDRSDWDYLERMLVYLLERAAHALRESGMEAKCLTLKVRYADFKTATFARTLPEATCIDSDFLKVLEALIPKAKERRMRVRLVGVGLSSLRYNQHQVQLFGRQHTEKWERVLEGVDAIRDRHGFESMRLGKSMNTGRDDISTPSLSK